MGPDESTGMKRTSLAALHEARGARWMQRYGCEIPACYSCVEEEYEALQEGAGLIDLSHHSTLLITGRDRRSWLHGQVTQEINGLADGRGAYATILNPQGHMVCDLRVWALPDALLVDIPPGTEIPIADYLNRYLIMERAEIEDLTESCSLLSVQGPLACYALGSVLGSDVCRLEMGEVISRDFDEERLHVARVSRCGEDGFDLFVPAGAAAPLWGALCQHRAEFSVFSVGWKALNIRRIEAGIPWWGEELTPSLVPLEARLDHAISHTKGCYVGQEIIARIHARGHVNNLLAGFLVAGEALPPRDSEIRREGKKVGRVASSVVSLRLERHIALGFLRRELQEPGTRVHAMTPEGEVELEVTSLPFVPHDVP